MNPRLVCFLYLLMRDTVTLGEVERLMKEVQTINPPMRYSNQHLVEYALDIEKRLVD